MTEDFFHSIIMTATTTMIYKVKDECELKGFFYEMPKDFEPIIILFNNCFFF